MKPNHDEDRSVTPGVAGSSPVRSAIILQDATNDVASLLYQPVNQPIDRLTLRNKQSQVIGAVS